MYDFTHIIDFIFKDKEGYKKLSDEDKEKFFFIINRKFARAFPKHAQYFNNKNIDKASALDIWYNFFIKKRAQGIPTWYWFKQTIKKEKFPYNNEEVEFLTNFYSITKKDLNFLIEYFPIDVEEEIKKFKKFNKKQ